MGELLTNSLLIFDAKDMSFNKVRMQPNPKCAVCGEHATIHELVDEEQPVCDLKAARSEA